MLTAIIASTLVTIPGSAIVHPESASLVQFLESSVPDELAVEGILLGHRELVLEVAQIGDSLLISLIATATRQLVASFKLDAPPADHETTLAIVTRVTATLYMQYAMASPLPSESTPNQPPQGGPSMLRRDPSARHGLTFEANLGIGLASLSDNAPAINTDAALAADFGLGGWLRPNLALTLRIAGNHVKYMATVDNLVNAFVGPSLQYWITPQVSIGGGAGFATYGTIGSSRNCASYAYASACGLDGWGLDLRAGYAFGEARTFNVSAELNPSFYSNNGTSVTVTGFALLAGYQFL